MPPWLTLNAENITKWPTQPPFPWRTVWDAERYQHFDSMQAFREEFRVNGFNRNDVVHLFQDALVYPEKRSLAIIAALLWGGVATGGRMGDRLLSVLQREETQLRGSFTCAFQNLQLHQIHEAYDCLQRGAAQIPNVGPSYFTKILFFLGLALDIRPLPLILDKWTGNAYAMLLLNIGNQEAFAKGFSRNRVDRRIRFIPTKMSADLYTNFVNDMNDWAEQLDIAPDHLEQFLFGTDLRRNQNGENPRLMIWNELLNSLQA